MTRLFDYWRSPAACRGRIALNHLGLRYTAVAGDLVQGEHRAPDNLARRPQGLVPQIYTAERVGIDVTS